MSYEGQEIFGKEYSWIFPHKVLQICLNLKQKNSSWHFGLCNQSIIYKDDNILHYLLGFWFCNFQHHHHHRDILLNHFLTTAKLYLLHHRYELQLILKKSSLNWFLECETYFSGTLRTNTLSLLCFFFFEPSTYPNLFLL